MKSAKRSIFFIIFTLGFILTAQGSEMPHVTGVLQLTEHTAHEYDASWSSDDANIVYIRDGHYKDEVWIMDRDGTNQRELFQNFLLSHPDWGPGGIIVVAYDRQPRDTHPNIWIIENDLITARRLTMNKTDLKYPSWNSDSTKILCLWKNNYKYEIYTMDQDASNLNRLTFLQTDVNTPSWSPDNSKIAYSYEDDIWIMNADATDLFQLTNDDYNQLDPTWSPDGEWIAFTSDEDGDKDIWIMRSDGTEMTLLINRSKDQADPAWSHEGSKLLFTSYENENGDVWEATLDFKTVEILTPTPTETLKTMDEEAKQNIPRLALLGAVIIILVVFFLVRRAVRRSRAK